MVESLKLTCLKIKKIGLCALNCPILKDNKCPELKSNKKSENKKNDIPDFLKNLFRGN